MANRNFYPFGGSLDPEVVMLDGYVRVSTSGTIVSQTLTGATVAAGTTGVYTITLDDTYNSLLSCVVTPVCASATDIKAQVVSAFPDTTGIITIRFVAVGTAANLPTNGGFFVHLALKNSGA
jgi:hypothetical protein